MNKDAILKIRVTPEELTRLREEADRQGQTVTRLVRARIFADPSFIPEEVAQALGGVARTPNPFRADTREELKARQLGIDQILGGVNRKTKK